MNMACSMGTLRVVAARAGLTLVFSVSIAGPWTSAAWADVSENSKSDQQPAGLEEVIVTAQRRSESLSSVPISVQAYTSEQLSQQAVTGPMNKNLSSAAVEVGVSAI
jgi:outer membrane receptor protein involved in Fe transport